MRRSPTDATRREASERGKGAATQEASLSLRTCATEVPRAGMPIEKVQRILGHSRIHQMLPYPELLEGASSTRSSAPSGASSPRPGAPAKRSSQAAVFPADLRTMNPTATGGALRRRATDARSDSSRACSQTAARDLRFVRIRRGAMHGGQRAQAAW